MLVNVMGKHWNLIVADIENNYISTLDSLHSWNSSLETKFRYEYVFDF